MRHPITTKDVPALLGFASFLALILALFAEFYMRLTPCILCIYERLPYLFVCILAVLHLTTLWRGGLVTPKLPRSDGSGWRTILNIMALAFTVGFWLAVYHLGTEQGWWNQASSCTASTLGAQNVEELYTQLSGTPLGDCHKPAWSLFGVTMAGWNAAVSLILAFIAVYGAQRGKLKNKFFKT